MDLSHFDLNLLRSLDVLLEERNVTRAAARLYVSQQAASGALQRLRNHFSDELLTRVGRNLQRTPLAESLIMPVKEALLAAQAALNTRPAFDPAHAERTCKIAMSDYGILVFLPLFLSRLEANAPRIRCHVEWLAEDSFERVEKGDLDFCMASHDRSLFGSTPGPRIHSTPLFQDDFVCIVDKKHPTIRGNISLETYKAARHNSADFGPGVATLVERAWATAGLDVNVTTAAPNFSALIAMLPGTRLITTAQRRLAQALAPSLGLRVIECPLPIAPLQELLMWHERNEQDPCHRYLRNMLCDAAADLDREMPASARSTSYKAGL